MGDVPPQALLGTARRGYGMGFVPDRIDHRNLVVFHSSECRSYRKRWTEDERIEAECPPLFRRIVTAPNEVRTHLRHKGKMGCNRHLHIGPH